MFSNMPREKNNQY